MQKPIDTKRSSFLGQTVKGSQQGVTGSRRRKSKVKSQSNRKYGYWRKSEQEKYKTFLRGNYLIMLSAQLRAELQMFKRMSVFIGSRDAVQCKSHHQKMLMRTNNKIQTLFNAQEIRTDHFIPEYCYREQPSESSTEYISKIKTNEEMPYFMIRTSEKLVIVIDERFVNSY